MVNLYTDASVRNNKGGCAYIIDFNNITISLAFTDNSKDINYLELLAVCEGLHAINTTDTITVYTDSCYVLNATKLIKTYSKRKNKAILRKQLHHYLENNDVQFILICGKNNKAHHLAREATNV